MVRKLFLIAGFSLILGFLRPVMAADLAPEFNPLCWKEKECERVRKEFDSSAKIKEGFVPNDPPCVGGDTKDPWGKCLPSTVAKTEIAFGGEREFLNIGDFIIKNYNFAISIAGVLAAMVIIMAGFQWATSGGNGDTISSAKHRIGGAIIGLFIAYSSYAILHTLNPNLVNLRLPQTWMLRPMNEMPTFCSQVPDLDIKFSSVAPATNQTSTIDTNKDYEFELSYNEVVKSIKINCGERFLSNKSGPLTCFGDVCGGKACININLENPSDVSYHCETGVSIYGEAVGNYLAEIPCMNDFEFPWFDDSSQIYRVCKRDGEVEVRLEGLGGGTNIKIVPDADKKVLRFKFGPPFSRNEMSEPACENGELLGFALGLNLNGNCQNIGDVILIDRVGNDIGEKNDGMLGLAGTFLKQKTPLVVENLFSIKDLEKGFRMNIDVSKYKDYPEY